MRRRKIPACGALSNKGSVKNIYWQVRRRYRRRRRHIDRYKREKNECIFLKFAFGEVPSSLRIISICQNMCHQPSVWHHNISVT